MPPILRTGAYLAVQCVQIVSLGTFENGESNFRQGKYGRSRLISSMVVMPFLTVLLHAFEVKLQPLRLCVAIEHLIVEVVDPLAAAQLAEVLGVFFERSRKP